jgi:hypothetical protein
LSGKEEARWKNKRFAADLTDLRGLLPFQKYAKIKIHLTQKQNVFSILESYDEKKKFPSEPIGFKRPF